MHYKHRLVVVYVSEIIFIRRADEEKRNVSDMCVRKVRERVKK